jgi:hypothetical protein
MLRGLRLAVGTAALLTTLGGNAWAQYGGYYGGYWGWGGWGATPVGDIARGMGAYAVGIGQYNLSTAQAISINTDTAMRWNSYLWASQNQLNRERYARMQAKRANNIQQLAEIEARLRDNPTNGDIERGDALNAILHQLSDPRIHPSALRLSRVPINNKWIQEIPFRYESEPITFSLHQLTAVQGNDWPTPLKGDDFKPEREAYQKAIDKALKQDLDGDLTPETIQAVLDATYRLRDKVEATIPKTSKDYVQAEKFLKSLTGMAQMLKSPNVEETLAAVGKFPGTTVADLLAFMQMYNLRFGAANTVRERKLYHDLYPLLDRERDQVVAQVLKTNPDIANPPQAVEPGQATAIFHEMPWEHLTGKGKPPANQVQQEEKDENK